MDFFTFSLGVFRPIFAEIGFFDSRTCFGEPILHIMSSTCFGKVDKVSCVELSTKFSVVTKILVFFDVATGFASTMLYHYAVQDMSPRINFHQLCFHVFLELIPLTFCYFLSRTITQLKRYRISTFSLHVRLRRYFHVMHSRTRFCVSNPMGQCLESFY